MLSRAIFLLSLSPSYFFFLTPRRRLFSPPWNCHGETFDPEQS